MQQYLRRFVAFAAMFTVASVASAQTTRPAVYAGAMYPGTPSELLAEVQSLFAAAPSRPIPGRLLASVVPHSAYPYCGDIIATGLKELQPGQYDRVIILSPGHLTKTEGCSIPDVETFTTPLGQVFLDKGAIRTLCFSSMFVERGLQYPKDGAPIPGRPLLHEYEYGIEVLLPFLQERIGVFRLVPIVVGSFQDTGGVGYNTRMKVAADKLREIMDERTLLIVSTDWTHYGKSFGYEPFTTNIAKNIENLDRSAMDAVLDQDGRGFQRYLQKTGNLICGSEALELLMEILPAKAASQELAYGRSMDRTKKTDRSISYAALNFYLPGQPAPAPHPERRLKWDFTRAPAESVAPPVLPEETDSTAPTEE